MRELFLLRWWVVGGGYQLPSAILDVIIPTTHHRSKNSFPHCLAAGSWKEVWNIGQDPANGSFCIVWGHTWIYGMPVTINPGRPEIPWPGDRQVVECGQHLGTWWRTCHFLLFFYFFFTVLYNSLELLYRQCHSRREPDVVSPASPPTMTILLLP